MSGASVRGLALFDFDKTLSDRDTLFDFHSLYFGKSRVYAWALRHVPFLLGCPLGWSDRGKLKENFLASFWSGVPYEEFARAARKYSLEQMPRVVRPRALKVLEQHLQRGDRVLVISASIKEWLEPWCLAQGVDQVLATEMEVQEGVLSGALATPNCRGPEKIRRLREVLNPQAYSPIYAYGDSDGDREMLALADYPVYRWRSGP
jgi:HAD superfamily hydrolase (TIGR01490 family)